MNRLKLTVLCGIFILMSALPASAQVLYLLSSGDMRDATIGKYAKLGADYWTTMMSKNLPAKNLVVYNGKGSKWTGDDPAKADNPFAVMMEAIEKCPATKEDGILVFWYGYGSFKEKNNFVFRVASGDSEVLFSRSEFRQAMKEKKIRFGALVTESNRYFMLRKGDLRQLPGANHQQLTPLVDGLLFDCRGYLDINSSQAKETSLMLAPYGGALVAACHELIETNDYKDLTWSDWVKRMNQTMQSQFHTRQSLTVFSLPKAPESKKPSENSAQNWNGDWGKIEKDFKSREKERAAEPYPVNFTKEDKQSFRSKNWSTPTYHPEAGDLLIGINGKKINNSADLDAALKNSGSTVYLTFIDHRTGKVYEMRTNLPASGGSANHVGNSSGQNPSQVTVINNQPAPNRLGIQVVNDSWGGCRLVSALAWAPIAHCQYLLHDLAWHYAPFPYRPVPYPVPYPVPVPDPHPPYGPIDPKDPDPPFGPIDPEDPEKPVGPIDPEDPEKPVGPIDPEDPEKPVGPIDPEDPEKPVGPIDPEDPEKPVGPIAPEDPEKPVDPEDPEFDPSKDSVYDHDKFDKEFDDDKQWYDDSSSDPTDWDSMTDRSDDWGSDTSWETEPLSPAKDDSSDWDEGADWEDHNKDDWGTTDRDWGTESSGDWGGSSDSDWGTESSGDWGGSSDSDWGAESSGDWGGSSDSDWGGDTGGDWGGDWGGDSGGDWGGDSGGDW